ncbi:MAG: hypothetical protein OCD76_14880 [Reichenbachiella sp.]
MKFPSFVKTQKYSRFEYSPRYYDAVKEEIDGKLRAAKARLKNGASDDEDENDHSSSISAAFSKRERKSSQASTVQLIIAAALLGTFVGWLFIGNDILYIFLILSPLYFYFRIKKKKSSN